MKQTNRFIYLLALLKCIIPYLLQSNVYEPHRDEFLYLSQGHHLAWGFAEVPPLLSLFAWLTHWLGGSIFWVKLWPDLFGALIFIIAAKTIQSLGGKKFAIFLMFLPFVFGVYLRSFFLFQPNAPEFFFWTLIGYSLLHYIQTLQNKWLYLLGISTGLGLMSKYSVAFYTVSILGALLLTRHRKVFLNKHLYFAGLLALIIFLPVVVWEYQHHFPVILHMKQLKEEQLQYVSPAGFLKDQLLMNLPCVFIWLAGLYLTGVSAAGRNYRVFAWAYLFVLILLLFFHGKNYYALGAYPMLLAFGAYYLEQLSVNRIAMRIIFVGIPVLIGVIFLPISLPVAQPGPLASYYEKTNTIKTGALKWEDLENHPLPQDFADMLGWREMTAKAAKEYNLLSSYDKAHTFLFCDNYGEAGALNYYGTDYHLPEAHSDNGSFLYWLPKPLYINNLLLVTDDLQEMDHPFIKDFAQVVAVDSVTNPSARERGMLIILLKGANNAFNTMFTNKIVLDYDKFYH